MAFLAIAVIAPTFGGLTAAPTASAGDSHPGPAGDAGSGWIPDVQVTTYGDADRRPALTTDSNGDILIAYESNSAGDYDIMFLRSSDYGRTWTPPVVVSNSATDEIHASIATDPFSGRIFIAYQRGTAGATTILVAYSDDGITWTNIVVFSCGIFCERPKIASEYWDGANNRQYVVFAGELSAGTDWDWVVFRSATQGDSWSFMYESGIGSTDVRHHPVVAVQHGTDGADRVIVFYRSGGSAPGTTGTMEWSEDYGASWLGPSDWVTTVNSPPVIAASHDGDSVLVAYSTAANNIIWAADTDPTDLTWGTGTATGQFTNGGTNVAIGVDGDGSTSLGIGGSYHLVARDTATNDVVYATAPTTLTGAGDWSPLSRISDSASMVSISYPEKAVTTVFRGALWQPAVAWTDFRDNLPDYNIYYTTTGSTYTIDTSPTGLQITIDGITMTAPAVMAWLTGEVHTISTASPQTTGPGSRYTFQSWSDGGAQTHPVTVGGNDVTITATFFAEVFLTLTSPLGAVTGAGWYQLGSTATISADAPQPGPTGTRYAFAAWTGDILSASNPATVVMDAPKTIIANWRTEYELTIVSAHGNVSGAGWYPTGETAQITLAEREVTEGGRTWQFTGWSGDARGAATVVNVTMDGPKTVTANWREKPGLLAGASGALVLIGILLVVLFFILAFVAMRRRKKPGVTFQQMQPMPGEATQAPPTPPPMPPQAPQPWPPQPPQGPPPPG